MASLPFLTVGRNQTRVFGLTPAERARRFAVKAKLAPVDAPPPAGAVLIAALDHASDPAWLPFLVGEPGLVVTHGGRPVLAHAPDPGSARAIVAAIETGAAFRASGGLREMRSEEGTSLYNHSLRKRENAYLLPLEPATVYRIEKASYDGAYKGVTDLLTLYLWRGAAFHLTRWAAWAGLTPNAITAFGTAMCVWTFFLFLQGHFWSGIGVGLVFMVSDTVDGKLARCTGTSSGIGNVLDHGLDLVHPPFWWWAWGEGCAPWGEPMSAPALWWVMAVIIGGYIVQRLIEGVFMRRFGMHIHVWQRIDSRFRLITARRNPNMVILVAALLVGRPREGLIVVAWWTALSCLFHLVRLVQAERAARIAPLRSWLA